MIISRTMTVPTGSFAKPFQRKARLAQYSVYQRKYSGSVRGAVIAVTLVLALCEPMKPHRADNASASLLSSTGQAPGSNAAS
jgi:hypothetical protein